MEKIISGKVREVYDVNQEQLVIVTSDRISAFDVILESQIPYKGTALNLLSNFWFAYTKDIVPNHIISTDLNDMPELFAANKDYYNNRTVLVKKLKMLPYEFIVRGYMFGNMWKSYKENGAFCGQKIEGEYQLAEKLATPILTPSKKMTQGHDEYISMEQLKDDIGEELTTKIYNTAIALYNACYQYAEQRGIIIADTKFEFGFDQDGTLTLADEIFTPDSSRFWDSANYKVGESPKSYDKQFVRDWLIEKHLDGVTPSGALPQEIIETTSKLYRQCCNMIIGKQCL